MTVITHPMASFIATILKDTFPSKYLFPPKASLPIQLEALFSPGRFVARQHLGQCLPAFSLHTCTHHPDRHPESIFRIFFQQSYAN